MKRSTSRSRSRSRSHGRPRQLKSPKSTRSKSKTPRTPRSQRKTSTDRKSSVERKSRSVTKEIKETPTRQSNRIFTRIQNIVDKEKEISSKIVMEIKKEVKNSMYKKDDDAKPVKTTKEKEFGGIIGSGILIFFLPLTVYLLNLACGKERCTVTRIPKIPSLSYFFDLEAALWFVGWLAFQILLSVLPIGSVVEGQPLRSGQRLKYRCNGFFALLISLAAFGVGVYFDFPLTKIYSKFFKLMTAASVFSVFLSGLLYFKSMFVSKDRLAPGGNTGNVIYDFFIGHELNPRIANFDLKFFFELRPGLIGWIILNLSFVLKAYKDTGTLPPALTMVTAFQTFYVADALFFEEAILTTMDIIHDGFGYMLVFGDLVWVPFLYTLQTRYLLNHQTPLPWYALVGIALLNLIGYTIFRCANYQKNEFRKNPSNPKLAHLETIPTSSGKKLLVSGWWGMCRKPNYLGDLLMALAWSLSCGLNLLTFFYPVYFLILLIHRERRDGELCKKKYGSSWDRYCQRVKYRILPYVY